MNGPTTLRLDIWLWAARFFKTRSLAKQAVETGKVEVDGQRAKPARTVRVGDPLKIARGGETFEVSVVALSEQRGSAERRPGVVRGKRGVPGPARAGYARSARRNAMAIARLSTNPTNARAV